MAEQAPEEVGYADQPAPDQPGWFVWASREDNRFIGETLAPMTVRREPDGKARLRMHPEQRHTNPAGSVHGGAILALIDVALFATAKVHGLSHVRTAMSLDLAVQFIGAGRTGAPLDAVGEVLRETGRLLFVRGLVEQDGAVVAAFSGTVRKPSTR
jgi:uncharacterized protein (TIGR00369 family)